MDVTINVAGATMDAHLHLPEGDGPSPAVLLCPGLTRDIAGLDFIRDALLEGGYAVLGIHYRGMDLLDDDEDVVAALDYLSEHPGVDSDSIAMVGHSRGSMVSLRTAANDARVKAVGAVHPVTDFLGYVRATRDYAPLRFEALIGRFGGADPDVDPAPYERYAALNYADRITVPTLLIAGTADMHSPAHHSVLMRDALVEHGNTETRLEIIDGSGHFFEVYYGGDCRAHTAKLVREWISAHV
jgi:dipeptidyl aminopeptidase/acylaminoacyl peptidase